MQLTDKIKNVLYHHSHEIQDNIVQKDSSNNWHMTRYIRKNIIPESPISFEKIEDQIFFVIYKNVKIAIYDERSLCLFQVLNPYVENKKVILSEIEMFHYYLKSILKNYLFFMYIIEENNNYIDYIKFLDDEKTFYSEIVSKPSNPVNLYVSITNRKVIVKIKNKYIKDLELTLYSGDDFFEFSITKEKDKAKVHKNFKSFLNYFNNYLYENIIYKTTNIKVEDFDKEQLKLFRILSV
jgi:hypothetical protein